MMIGRSRLVGAAGEHHVMSELLLRGMIGALAPEGMPNIDILVSSGSGNNLAAVQVKTTLTQNTASGWRMMKKHEDIENDGLFYCFVNLFEDEQRKPECFIVPNNVVRHITRISHKSWLSTTKADGSPKKNTDMRTFSKQYKYLNTPDADHFQIGWLENYKSRWELLMDKVGH